jgi:hypothetical protein
VGCPVPSPREVACEHSVRSVWRVPNEEEDTAGPMGLFLRCLVGWGFGFHRPRAMFPSPLGVRPPWLGPEVELTLGGGSGCEDCTLGSKGGEVDVGVLPIPRREVPRSRFLEVGQVANLPTRFMASISHFSRSWHV